jgi:hypothetical protein
MPETPDGRRSIVRDEITLEQDLDDILETSPLEAKFSGARVVASDAEPEDEEDEESGEGDEEDDE